MPKNKKYSIGIDLGGTKMSAVLFDGEKVIMDCSLATPKDNLEHIFVMMLALIEPLEEKANELKIRISKIGLGVAGVIDYREGKILYSPNIPLIDGVCLARELEKRTGFSVIIDNDGNCFTRAVAVLGVAKKYDNVYGFIIGTGIGGGWWINNDIYRAPFGGSGEPGEMIIDFNTGIKLEEAYHKLTQNNPALLAEEAYRGDVLAEKSYEELGEFLGLALANIVNLIAPEVIVLGGGAINSSDLFLSIAKKTMKENISSSEAKKNIKILKSKIGKHAGAIGAACLVK
ncbi:MAG: ROK family protein [Patescibacteria group bacterium]|nr:ROK family protein [Patescibacteria group bacterium]